MIDYIFQFPDIGSAQRDAVVGSHTRSAVLVFHLRQNSVSPLSGYWCLITSQSDAALASHPNIQIVSDNALARAGKPSVISAKLDVTDIQVMIDTIGNYIAAGLKMKS